ncbi:vitamin B12 dependent-methionine synthase activation domain-containing protein [Chloroflexota bacterium]
MVTVSNRFDINRQRVFCDIGYDTDCKPSARMASLVNDYAENVHDFIEPLYSYVIRDIESVKGDRVVIEGPVTFQSEVIAHLMERAKKVVVFTLTIGSHLEELVAHLARTGLVLQAAVLDAIGSDAAEKLADFVENVIGELAHAQGLTISRRFSPGYCDWDVSQQKMIFHAMKGDCAGVNLTGGCLMLPRKSISGIIGIGTSSVEDYNPCKTCDKHDCVGRR